METKKTLKGKLNLILGGSKDNAAIGKRLDGPNGAPVLHAEFFKASISETDDKGVRHAYDFDIDPNTAEMLANANSFDQYEVQVSLHFKPDPLHPGVVIEDTFRPDGKATVHHKCTLDDYQVLSTKTPPSVHTYCLNDAKPARDTKDTAPKADATATMAAMIAEQQQQQQQQGS